MDYLLEHFGFAEVLKALAVSGIAGFELGLLGSHVKKAWPVTLAVTAAALLILLNSPIMAWVEQIMTTPFTPEIASGFLFVGLLFGVMLSGIMRLLMLGIGAAALTAVYLLV